MSIDRAKFIDEIKAVKELVSKQEKENSTNEPVIEEEEIVITVEEAAEKIIESIEDLDEILFGVVIKSDDVFNLVKQLRDEEYSKLNYKERVKIIFQLNGYLNAAFSGILPDDVYVSEQPIAGKTIYIEENKIYFYKELFADKHGGLSVLHLYIYSIRKHMTEILTESAFSLNIDPKNLKGLSRIYYDNMSRSILLNSWTNKLNETEKNYSYQPIVFDSLKLSRKIMFELSQKLYQEYKVIDKSMSHILYDHMDYLRKYRASLKKRNEMILEERKNIKNYDLELDNYTRYLERTLEDVSTFNDDEFYELFNSSYYNALYLDEDGNLVHRLTNLCNELVRRPFRDFDISNVEFPKYEVKYYEDEDVMTIVVDYDGEIMEENIQGPQQAFSVVLTDVSLVAQKNKLIKFNNEKEKKDYMDMATWCDMKHHDYSDPADKEIVSDGLNIILQKVSELLSDIQTKSTSAINKSSFTPRGKTMLRYESKDAYYDYHEFKNCHTKQDIQDALTEYIRLDIEDMKKRGGR